LQRREPCRDRHQPTVVDLDIASFDPAQVFEASQQRCDIGLSLRITFGVIHEHAQCGASARLAAPARERPGSRRAAESVVPPSGVMKVGPFQILVTRPTNCLP